MKSIMDRIVSPLQKAKNVMCAAFAVVLMVSSASTAFTAPVAGDLGFDFYDILINQGIQGPVGFSIGFIAVIMAIFGMSQRNWFMAAGGLAGTTALVAGDSIVTGVGFLV